MPVCNDRSRRSVARTRVRMPENAPVTSREIMHLDDVRLARAKAMQTVQHALVAAVMAGSGYTSLSGGDTSHRWIAILELLAAAAPLRLDRLRALASLARLARALRVDRDRERSPSLRRGADEAPRREMVSRELRIRTPLRASGSLRGPSLAVSPASPIARGDGRNAASPAGPISRVPHPVERDRGARREKKRFTIERAAGSSRTVPALPSAQCRCRGRSGWSRGSSREGSPVERIS